MTKFNKLMSLDTVIIGLKLSDLNSSLGHFCFFFFFTRTPN